MSETKIDPALLEYTAEGKEILERVSKNLALIEAGQTSSELLGSIYRDVHTLKGNSQLFGFPTTAQLSHALEACLDPVRHGRMSLTPKMVEACAKSLDLLEKLLNSIEATGQESANDPETVKKISSLIEAATTASQSAFSVLKDQMRVEDPVTAPPKLQPVPQQPLQPSSSQPNTEDMTAEGKPRPAPANLESKLPSSAEVTIRVQVSLLDRILNLVGELVLVRNQLIQFRHRITDADFLNTSKGLDAVTSDLQTEIMRTRMQPIETVVGKFQRVVRDIARDLGKKIDLTLEGSETELDKSLLEAIKDPLTHIVRNSCDHGIESPDERKAANKPDSGHLLIHSYHEGGQVVIDISDDGRGISRARVLKKALEKGLINQEKAAGLSDREICELIFLPGFSTAEQVTSVSGRGVGMDVVKTNIEKIGGSVEIRSTEGKGTTLQLRIPLTLAIVPALIVRSGVARFAIPQVKLVELVRAEKKGQGGVQLEQLQGRPMFRLRGHLLPLYDLREITGEPYDTEYKDGVFIVVLNTDGENFGLLVPEILDTADIVVKPMNSLLSGIVAFSGATILGDGSIALILDVSGVAEYGKVLNKKMQKEDHEAFSRQERARLATDSQEFLLFSVGADAPHALPLCLVNRLEEFLQEEVEQSGQQRVVRYRDGLLPLIDLSNYLNYEKKSETSAVQKLGAENRIAVIVVQRSGRSYGLVVDEIVDIMTVEGTIDDSIRDRNGILGNLIHNDEVIVVIDTLGIIEDFQQSMHGKRPTSPAPSRDRMGELRDLNRERKYRAIRVLYAEDVAFFRKHVSRVLDEAGIDVTTVEDGRKALQELEASKDNQYNLILTDIEMPNMGGIELAREIRKNERFRNLPLIALTTRFREKDIKEGKAAGFDRYLEKLNPDTLLGAIQELMNIKSPTSQDTPDVEIKEGALKA